MSITRRILDGAQSGISKFTSLVIADDEPLTNVESAALQVELIARKAAREKTPRDPLANPLAKLAVSDATARAARDKSHRERHGRVHREREQREAKAKVAADEAFRRMKEQAAKGNWSTGSTTSSSSSTSSGPRPGASPGSARAARPGSTGAQIADWLKVLGLVEGADMAQIKSAYRQMMRKYHPDMHAANPQKQKAANELSMRVTTAYNGLVAHFDK